MEKEVQEEDTLATSGAIEAITIHVDIVEVIDMSMMDKILIPAPVLTLIKDFIVILLPQKTTSISRGEEGNPKTFGKNQMIISYFYHEFFSKGTRTDSKKFSLHCDHYHVILPEELVYHRQRRYYMYLHLYFC